MHIAKLSVRLGALAAAIFAVMLVLSSLGQTPQQRATADTGAAVIDPSVTCVDVYAADANIFWANPFIARTVEDWSAGPHVDDINIGISMTRTEPSQTVPGAAHQTSLTYLGADDKWYDEPPAVAGELYSIADLQGDKPPTALSCADKDAAGAAAAEAGEMHEGISFAALSNYRELPPGSVGTVYTKIDDPLSPGTDIWQTFASSCWFDEVYKNWVRQDVTMHLREQGKGSHNYGYTEAHYGGPPPAGALDTDGDTKPETAVNGTDCVIDDPENPVLYTFYSMLDVYERNATTDHPAEQKNIDLAIATDTSPLGSDSADGLADDWDGDGCTDWDELDKDFPGGRDPFNPNDCDWNYTGVYTVLATVQAAIDDPVTGEDVPGTYFHCIAAIDHDKGTNDLDAKMVCYTDSPGIDEAGGSAVPTRQDGNAWGTPPPPFTNAPVIDLNGVHDKVNSLVILDGCVEDTGGVLGPNIIIHAELDDKSLKGFVDIHPVQTIADCDAKTPNQHAWNLPLKILGTPLALAEQDDDIDNDGDGCTSWDEIMQTGSNCGDDPFNPYDSDESVDSISSMLVTALRQDVDKVTGARIPGAYFHCISDTQHNGDNTLDVKVLCYIDNPVLAVNAEESGVWPAPGCCGDGDPDTPPPAPFADIDDNHVDMTGVYDKGTHEIQIAGCFDDKDAQSSLGDVYTEMVVNANTGIGEVSIYPYQPPACVGSPIGTVVPTPMQLAEQNYKVPKTPGSPAWDNDQDGCSDKEELGEVAAAGGLRDPFNPWDVYDVNEDSTVDLFNDIFGVAFKFGTGAPEVPPVGTYDYAEAFDRGGSLTGSNVWNQRPADGTIDLFNDIFGVAFQFGHTCDRVPLG